MDKSQEALIEEGSALYGGFEGLLEKLPFQASTLRLIKAKQIKMSDKLRGDIERLIEARRVPAAPELTVVPEPMLVPLPEPEPIPRPTSTGRLPMPPVSAAGFGDSLANPLAGADDMRGVPKGETIEVDHPEAVAALFDEATRARLAKLAAVSRLSPAQLIRVGTLRYMDQIEKTGEIIIRFDPKAG